MTDETTHTSEETRDFHNRDRLIRRHGYLIYARPNNGEAMWIHKSHRDKIISQSAVLLRLEKINLNVI